MKEAPADELIFVRDGFLAPGGAGGRALGPDGMEWHALPWSPGDRVERGGTSGTAPQVADCVTAWSVPLGDVSRLVAQGGTAPDTALAFSPDGERLAVGSYRGEVLVLDGWSGEVLARRRLAETMVKQVAWSPDGGTLYAAEQSPDALVQALDPASLQTRWSLRLADHVGSSPAPDGRDLYGVYTLPAAYALELLPGGDLLVGATHAWPGPEGARLNRSRVLRVSPEGAVRAAWPAEAAADATLSRLQLGPRGEQALVSVGRSASGPAPPELPIGGLQLLDLAALEPRGAFVPEPLAPHFQATFAWEAIDLVPEQNLGLVGLADGRVFGWSLDGSLEPWMLEVSTPILAGEIPISASIGYGRRVDDSFVAITSGTNIPFASSSTAARPPSPHPAANRIGAWSLEDRRLLWTWSGPQALNGLVLGPDGRTGVVGTGGRSTDKREDAFGALVFRLDGTGSGSERLLAFCPTEGPTFFRTALSLDGRVAVAEHPWLRDDGSQAGAYRVTVLR